MNLYKIALSLLVTGASSVSAGRSAEENSAIRKLAAKFDDFKAEVDGLKSENDALKARIASLEKKGSRNSTPKDNKKSNVRRGMQEIPLPDGVVPDDIPEFTEADIEGIVGLDPNLSNLLFGLIHRFNQFVGLSHCVAYSYSYGNGEGACTFGNNDVQNTFITAGEDVHIQAPDEVYIYGVEDVIVLADENIILDAFDEIYVQSGEEVIVQENFFKYNPFQIGGTPGDIDVENPQFTEENQTPTNAHAHAIVDKLEKKE